MDQAPQTPIQLIATTAFGLEAVVARELTALGYESQTIQAGRLAIEADLAAICRLNLELRSAERVMICLGRFEATDFGQLFDQTKNLPWETWIPADGSFPVRGRSVKSQLSSVPACQRMVKKAVADRLLAAHQVAVLEETGGEYRIEVALLDNIATLTIDTTGAGLHKRGYRPISGKAPLRETLAAALVQLSFWKPERPLIDPFCGTGTIPIEAALIARQIAPGLNRHFAAEAWPCIPSALWETNRQTARDKILPTIPQRILGLDSHEGALQLARRNAIAAGVADDIHFQCKPFSELSSKQQYGCLITNPPYGERMGAGQRSAPAPSDGQPGPRAAAKTSRRTHRDVDQPSPDIVQLYRSIPTVLRRLPTWSHYIITNFPKFEAVVGQSADRRRKIYNGRIECQYYQFHGPRPPQDSRRDVKHKVHTALPSANPSDAEPAADGSNPVASAPRQPAAAPVFGGLKQAATRQAEEFANRLRKRARHLRKWPKRGITCYRLYERDIPEIPLVVDRYEDRLHMAEFARPHDRTPAEHADWLDLMKRTAAEVMEIHPANVFMKFRDRQRGESQYERRGSDQERFVVHEAGLKFVVNLSDYVDTGLFLDHRLTRAMVRKEAADQSILNLFGYTGSFSVYAAAGGAAQTVTVDLSPTYLEWAGENMRLNGYTGTNHRFLQSDAMNYVRDLHPDVKFDLAVVDPPTFSNSKNLDRDWEVQRDHGELLNRLLPHISPGGAIYFSTNFRRFKLDPSQFPAISFHEISQQTVPEDFRNRRIHRCWRGIVG